MAEYAELGIDVVDIVPFGPDPVAIVSALGDRVVGALAELGPS
jgi:hypothetical protein